MDFLEGSLLGPNYSDTRYGERKHKGKFVLVFFVFYISLTFLAKTFSSIAFPLILGLNLLILVAAFLSSPFLNQLYYKFSLFPRFLILLVQILKRWSALNLFALFLLNVIFQFSEVSGRVLFEAFGNRLSDLFTVMSAKFDLLGLLLTLFIFMFTGIVVILLVLVLLFFLPNFVLFLLGKLQEAWDSIVKIKIKN